MIALELASDLEQAPNAPAAFEVDRLTTAYRGRPALCDISCAIPDRRVTAIIGPSGCGKSTLVRALNRTLELTPGARLSGSVRFGGLDLYAPGVDPRAARRSLGLIHQQPVAFPMSILENVLFGALFHGLCKKADRESYARVFLEQVNLWEEVKDRLHERASRLSGGQLQRLCLARALANGPRAILMDEPCSALDPFSTRHIEEQILALRDSYPIVIVTHDIGQARRISDHVLFLVDGRLVEAGLSRQIFETPRSRLAGAFISGHCG
ncbi:phosphate ABC transporter ATP-binding protein [Methylosinus sp. KRF6]|uniref:phosphate ABC transporter ATP-binding protein n=1 Tax=Methylosinus sp. KRF6 TaxID=2846853 RepID=UPI001C0B44C2|nr:phosphate ABC transporter ATP-binding protein [Methylosinus sp. KRF6]MBU3889301.1 phosphate ABC transporter ATP-binding protein [Methylosinus sp. KRF6]